MLLNTYEPWKFAFSTDTDFNNIKKDSYGIIGVPFDSTTSYHSGSRLGPIVVREASYGFENYNINFNTSIDAEFYDFGDVNVVPGNCKATCEIVEDTVNELFDLGVRPITIGGEHSASIGVIKALSEKYDKLTVVHLDAHRDLAFDFIGEKYSHATVMRRAHEFGADLVQIGIRSSSNEEEEFVKSTYNIQTLFSLTRRARIELSIASAATPTSANTASHILANPNAPSISIIPFTPSAKIPPALPSPRTATLSFPLQMLLQPFLIW